eukprot:scaffold15173_cov20-Tisochrysis_lutea.AAC.2
MALIVGSSYFALQAEGVLARFYYTMCVHARPDVYLAEGVQRFVVVHGQIILNQFRHYPNKAVQRAAFTTELKRNMETRKHHKLYMSKVCVCVRVCMCVCARAALLSRLVLTMD